jgi:hypothetical protein
MTVLPRCDRIQADSDMGIHHPMGEERAINVAGQVDYVIGIDTHRDTNTAAVVEASTDATSTIRSAPPTPWLRALLRLRHQEPQVAASERSKDR